MTHPPTHLPISRIWLDTPRPDPSAGRFRCTGSKVIILLFKISDKSWLQPLLSAFMSYVSKPFSSEGNVSLSYPMRLSAYRSLRWRGFVVARARGSRVVPIIPPPLTSPLKTTLCPVAIVNAWACFSQIQRLTLYRWAGFSHNLTHPWAEFSHNKHNCGRSFKRSFLWTDDDVASVWKLLDNRLTTAVLRSALGFLVNIYPYSNVSKQ